MGDFLFVSFSNTCLKFEDAFVRKILSCGLFGPEIVGTISDISKDKVSVNSISLLIHKPCSLEYSSTIFIVSSFLPENLRYFNVSPSIGKKPHVAPYSGAIFAIVALSARVKFFKPSP